MARMGGGSMTSNTGAGNVGTMFNKVFTSKAPNAPIKPPKVARPSLGTYGADPTRPVIAAPDRNTFGKPSDMGLKDAAKDVGDFRAGFNDPTKTKAFANIMGVAEEKGASALGEIAREGRNAASHAGYTGGFHANAQAADAARFSALSQAAFEGAGTIREQEGSMYQSALAALTSRIGSYNAEMGASNRAFGGALADRNIAQASSDLGFSKLVQDKNLSFADATAHANELQAQLDQAYNNSMIDNARYTQMSQSLQAQLAAEQARLKEEGRQFDLTRADSKESRALALEEAAKLRRERGVDPNTGQKFGQGHLKTGKPGSVFGNI